MSAIIRSFCRLGPISLTVVTFGLAACAVAQEPDEDENQNTGNNGPVGNGGSAGNAASTAGTNSGAGKPATGGGGTPSTSSGGQVSSGGSTGGTPATGTAGTPATGGTTAGTCPPYTGTLAKDSTIFTAGFGKSTTGMWSGYGYTYKYGTATITPGMGNSCFAGAKFCANGSVPADDKSGAGLGWNISQMMGASTTTKAAVTTPVKLTVAGMTAGMRVQLSASATVSYCYTITAAEATAGTVTIPVASFKTDCWGSEGIAYDGVVAIEAIQIAVPGSTAGAAKPFDFCVVDVEPG
jgi:hypothetical protein